MQQEVSICESRSQPSSHRSGGKDINTMQQEPRFRDMRNRDSIAAVKSILDLDR
jgi:hypothetical protein